MEKVRFPMWLAALAIAFGLGLQLYLGLSHVQQPIDGVMLALIGWSLVPYLACALAALKLDPNQGFFAAIACIIGDLAFRALMEGDPFTMMAALVFSPLFGCCVFLPLGVLFGYFNRQAAQAE